MNCKNEYTQSIKHANNVVASQKTKNHQENSTVHNIIRAIIHVHISNTNLPSSYLNIWDQNRKTVFKISNVKYTDISLIQTKKRTHDIHIIVTNHIKIRLRFSQRISNFIHVKIFLIQWDNIKTNTAIGNNAKYHNQIK